MPDHWDAAGQRKHGQPSRPLRTYDCHDGKRAGRLDRRPSLVALAAVAVSVGGLNGEPSTLTLVLRALVVG